VVQVPRSELHGAYLHFQVMEERVMKARDGKRCEAFQCSAVLRVALPKALQYSEPPTAAVAAAAASSGGGGASALSSEDVCSCWYPLKELHNGGQGSELLVAVSLAEVSEEADTANEQGGIGGSFDREALARNVGNRASTVRVSHGNNAGSGGGVPPSPGGGGGSESGEESGDEEDDEVMSMCVCVIFQLFYG